MCGQPKLRWLQEGLGNVLLCSIHKNSRGEAHFPFPQPFFFLDYVTDGMSPVSGLLDFKSGWKEDFMFCVVQELLLSS